MSPLIALIITSFLVGTILSIFFKNFAGYAISLLFGLFIFGLVGLFTSNYTKKMVELKPDEYFVTINKDIAAYVYIPQARITISHEDIFTYNLIANGDFVIIDSITEDFWRTGEVHHYKILPKENKAE